MFSGMTQYERKQKIQTLENPRFGLKSRPNLNIIS
jgi:hypothetical protein